MTKKSDRSGKVSKSDRKSARVRTLAALDIGSAKIACMIARDDGKTTRVIGIGHQKSDGVRAGQVTRIEDLEAAIRTAVARAEKAAGERIDSVVINVSCGEPKSSRLKVELPMEGHLVRTRDVEAVMNYGRQSEAVEGQDIIHCDALSFSMDETEGLLDPRGRFGEKLGVTMHVVTASSGQMINLETAVERSHLDVEAKVLTPYASALACLTDEEKAGGVIYIDMGAGVTSVAIFCDLKLIHAGVIPYGGHHITADISQVLRLPFDVAERLKTMYGTCLSTTKDYDCVLTLPQTDDETNQRTHEISQKALTEVIRPRLEEIFELVRDLVSASGIENGCRRTAVLSGGASQLQGVRDHAEVILECPVSIRSPQRFRSQSEFYSGPAFSTLTGLMKCARNMTRSTSADLPFLPEPPPQGLIGRVANWFKEYF